MILIQDGPLCHKINFILSNVRSYCNNISIQENCHILHSFGGQVYAVHTFCIYLWFI